MLSVFVQQWASLANVKIEWFRECESSFLEVTRQILWFNSLVNSIQCPSCVCKYYSIDTIVLLFRLPYLVTLSSSSIISLVAMLPSFLETAYTCFTARTTVSCNHTTAVTLTIGWICHILDRPISSVEVGLQPCIFHRFPSEERVDSRWLDAHFELVPRDGSPSCHCRNISVFFIN